MFSPECSNNGVSSCPVAFDTIPVREAQARFRREAVCGVCATGRYRLPFVVWGNGPTLVCIPGLVDDALSFLRPLALLSRHFRCIAYDWPSGAGDGAHMPTYRHRDLVSDLMALLDHVGAPQASVLGYSFGSTVALTALREHPERLVRGILVSGFACRPLTPPEEMLACLGRYLPGDMAQLPLRTRVLRALEAWAFERCETDVWNYYLERTGGLSAASVAYRACILRRIDLRALLPQVRQAVLLLCGDADPLVSKKCETELLLGLPNVARVELPRCGHHALYTHPELMAEVIVQFCTSGTPGHVGVGP